MSDWSRIYPQLLEATGETLYMVGVSALVTVLLGVPLGVLLTVTAPGDLAPRRWLHQVLGLLVNGNEIWYYRRISTGNWIQEQVDFTGTADSVPSLALDGYGYRWLRLMSHASRRLV